eukprot:gnl/Trimastix_PCT/4705.p1 GENE.gnl/Trimastix_PCT/4705~~gnl/Trimastix_PCT/4705.p1  ORF type:complete len:217 (-),score=28.92 gnl/Trimastix_PCT/4705:13-612(-)
MRIHSFVRDGQRRTVLSVSNEVIAKPRNNSEETEPRSVMDDGIPESLQEIDDPAEVELRAAWQRHLARYERLRIIDKGAFGTTFLVRDRNDMNPENRYVIKIISDYDPKETTHEAAMLVRLGMDHPDTFPKLERSFTFDCGGRKHLALAMTYFAGRNLISLQNQLDEPQLRVFLDEMLDILDKLEQHGVVHRDIKPAAG